MSKTLDEKDEQMLSLLRANARMPLVALAKKLNLSRSATQERLRRLEHHNVISRYTIQFGPRPDASSRAWLILRFQDGFRCADVVPHVLQHPEVRLCHSVAGDIDLIILIDVPTASDILATREKIAAIKGVASVQSSPVMVPHFE